MANAIITSVYGNLLRLRIPLTLRVINNEGETPVATDADFIPNAEYPVMVIFADGAKSHRYNAVMDGNVAVVEVKGDLPIGTWSLTILCRDEGGNPMRFAQSNVVKVVNYSAQAGLEPGIEFQGEVHVLDAAVNSVSNMIKGDPGEPGPAGPAGPKGDPGSDGRDGIDGAPLFVPVTFSGDDIISPIDYGAIRNAIVEDHREVILCVGNRSFYNLYNVLESTIVFSFIGFDDGEHSQSFLVINENNEWSYNNFPISGEGGSATQVQADWNQTTTTAPDYIKNKPTIPAAQIQADWNQTNTSAKDFIKNKPTIPDTSNLATKTELNNKQDVINDLAAIRSGAAAGATAAQPSDLPNDLGDLTNNAGYTKNLGTITGITMNGASKGTSGVVDLGTVITEHQSLSGCVTTISFNAALAGKQDTLTFDTTPTANSNKPVTSGGIKTYVDGKETITGITTNQDGTFTIALSGGDTYTVNLNHTHEQYLKYELLADEAAYNALTTKDSSTLYLIPEEE